MITDNNYYQISGWMINRLNLKGNELQAYAIIYGFTQDGQNWYTGSLAYLGTWLNCSRRTVINTLSYLVEKGLLIKESIIEKGQTVVRYRANLAALDFTEAPKQPAKQAELLYNPTKKPAPKAKKPAEPQKDAFDEYAGDRPELLAKLREFEANRVALKAKMTTQAKTLLVNKLEREFSSDSERTRALNEAIINGWKSVFPEKGITKTITAKNYNYDYSNKGLKEGVDYL